MSQVARLLGFVLNIIYVSFNLWNILQIKKACNFDVQTKKSSSIKPKELRLLSQVEYIPMIPYFYNLSGNQTNQYN